MSVFEICLGKIECDSESAIHYRRLQSQKNFTIIDFVR